ncbi:lysozyme [Paraburkholderia bannensis]|uniref:Lysozyme n=1 Tax=Paraburkholderia bannensis TaxID=765414 RepID=A0A7W9TUZ9_9BURK|nr:MULTISPECIES: lysozyme [Paraburkholderia]MBB3256844.1 lysozyme [Paraburkholderia sp. WP4_3_2]MBB6101842.1 lysozyme [Paraburkholderia bannensis]
MILTLLYTELRRDEGVRTVPYKDTTGNLTVGVGHNLTASPLPAGWTYPLSQAQITQLLITDVANTIAQLNASAKWWGTLCEVRQRVVANMAFNLGITKFLGFEKAISAMKEGAWDVAADEMQNSLWFKQVGDRAVRLCQAMRTGVMPVASGVA